MSQLFSKWFIRFKAGLGFAREPRSASERHVWLLNTPGWRATQEINR